MNGLKSVPATPLESPLVQVNTVAPTLLPTKFAASWSHLCTNPALFAGQNASSVARFFGELFCLRVSTSVLLESVNKLSAEDLLGSYKSNMTHLFVSAVKVLKEADRDDTRRDNVIETLIPFLRNILGRRYTNFSFEVMTLLCGSLERSDGVFTDLVSAIDLTLADIFSHTELRHRTLQLALVIVSSVNQGSINAFFLRRDLFSTLVKFMSDPATSPFAFESALLLGLLANFRKYEARNPYLVRIEDLVEEAVMERVIEVASAICVQTREAYTNIVDDLPPSFVASLTSLIFSLRLSDVFSSFSLSLPPPPTPSSAARKGKGKEIVEEDAPTPAKSRAAASELTNGATAPVVPTKGSVSTAPKTPKRDAKEESAFRRMPPEMIVILLPFYDLLNSNKAFCTLIFAETPSGPSPLPPSLISLSSYVFCHAAVSERARGYSRLCLIILTILVEEGDGKLTGMAPPIRLCRQRLPTLAYNNSERPALAAMLDAVVIYLRHNLHKRLDSGSYTCALRLIQRIMQQLKTERVRLDYDWVLVWRAIMSLSAFIVSKIEDLRTTTTKMDDLISQIFIVISYAAYWGESFFPTTRASVLLHYEIMHADNVLDQLSDLLGITSTATPDPTSVTPARPRDTPARSLFFSSSPKRTQFGLTRDGPPSFFATECVSNIRSSISFFSTQIEARRASVGGEDEFDAEQVMAVIEANLGALELIDAAAMADLRRYSESGQEAYFRSFSSLVCADVLALVPVD